MKNSLLALTFTLFNYVCYCQTLLSGIYDYGLKLAYDSVSHKITGYYENYGGFDETTNSLKFSCLFYIEGKIIGNRVSLNTYYPEIDLLEVIKGSAEIINKQQISLKLDEEHGGCWNVQHFSEEAIRFSLTDKSDWLQIRFVKNKTAYFYSFKSEYIKSKAYLVKGDFVCIDRLEGEWAYCNYFGDKKITKGWIKVADLNKL